VLDCVRAHDVKIVGLSALMTSTVTGMKETIDLLHAHTPQVKIMVGGAVLNAEYAQMVGADFYAKDAAESAKFAAQVLG
jgi:5-methyltetrahydrofolate--homocysteine methyltransferase